jgi:hypothetical protein
VGHRVWASDEERAELAEWNRSEALFRFVARTTPTSERPGARERGLQMPLLGPEQAVLIEVFPGS